MRRTLLLVSIFLLFSLYEVTAQESATDRAMQSYYSGRDLESRNRMNDAAPYYNEAVRLCQDEVARTAANADTYAVISWTLQRQRRYADVIAWGARGLRLYPEEYRIIETMGEAYFYLDDYDNSLKSMQRYTNARPQGERASVAYFFIGEIYRLQSKWRHADIAYTTALRLESGIALWWYRLATVREAAGDRSASAEAFRRTLALDPGYAAASEGLARVTR